MATASRFHLIASAFSLALLAGAASLPESLLAQQSGQSEASQQKTRKTPAMREKVYTKLSEAQVCSEADDMNCARRLLDEVREMKDLNSYETAQMWNFYAFIYYSQDNYREALRAYENVLAQPDLPIALEQGTMYTLAQLYFTSEQYQKALDMLDRWFAVAENPSPEAYILKAQGYYQLERYRDGIAPTLQAIEVARSRNQQPKENWYLLLRVFHYELEDYPKVRDVLETLATNWPKKDYFTQLAAIYGELDQESKQLHAYEAAHAGGWLERSSELVQLAQLFMQAEVPYKAAKVMEDGLNDGTIEGSASNWRLLSQAWTLSQEDEKAIPALQKAAQLSNDGILDVRLAQSYLNLDRYEPCVEAAREGLRKGNLRRSDSANVVLGMCLYELKRYNEAKTAFRAAAQDRRSTKTASQWMEFIDKEVERERQLRDAMKPLTASN